MNTTNPARNIIQNSINTHDVMLFMKGTPELPQCGFSSMISKILRYLGVNFNSINVMEDESVRQEIKIYSNWPTIPQLYVKGEFVGGCDIIREMFENGELKNFLQQKNIPLSSTETT